MMAWGISYVSFKLLTILETYGARKFLDAKTENTDVIIYKLYL